MKSRCSFILKALTASVLVFLLVFGAVATPLAAVVDNTDTGSIVEDLAETGTSRTAADLGYAVYFSPGSSWSTAGAKFQVQLYFTDGDTGWDKGYMTKIPNKSIYVYYLDPSLSHTYTQIQFLRMNPDSPYNQWNYSTAWSLPATGNFCTKTNNWMDTWYYGRNDEGDVGWSTFSNTEMGTVNSDVLAGTKIEIYVESHGDTGYSSNITLGSGGNTSGLAEGANFGNFEGLNKVALIRDASATIHSNTYISNNIGSYVGVNCSALSSATGGSLYYGHSVNGSNSAAAATTTTSALSYADGTTTIPVTTSFDKITSAYGDRSSVHYLYYIDGNLASGNYPIPASTSDRITDVSISSLNLAAGNHTLKTIATDGALFWIADTDTFEILAPDVCEPTFTSSDAHSMNLGDTYTNTASHGVGCPGEGTITYNSSNTEVATVTSSGVVTAIAPGSATITAHCSNNGDDTSYDASYSVSVQTPEISVSDITGKLIGEDINPTITKTNISNGIGTIVFDYTESDNGVVNIALDHSSFSAKAPGTANLTAYYQIGGVTKAFDTFSVTVENPTLELSVDENSLTSSSVVDLFLGGRRKTITTSLGNVSSVGSYSVLIPTSTGNYTFASSDSGNTFTITSLSTECPATDFTAKIYMINGVDVQSKNISASAKVKVTAYSLDVDENALNLYTTKDINGADLAEADKARDYINTKTLTVTHNSSSDYHTRIDIASSNESVATVAPTTAQGGSSTNITITPVAPGTASITVKYIDVDKESSDPSNKVLATKTIPVTVSNYKKTMTIYFDDNNANNWNGNDDVYVYHFNGNNESGYINSIDSNDKMVLVGRRDGARIYAQTYNKVDVMGKMDSEVPGALIFAKGNNITATTKTSDIFSDGASGDNKTVTFSDYTYFKISTPNYDDTHLIDQYNYGSLLPTAASAAFSSSSITRSDADGDAKTLALGVTVGGYTYSGTTPVTGYYSIDEQTLLSLSDSEGTAVTSGAMTSASYTVSSVKANGTIPATTVEAGVEKYDATVSGTVYFTAAGIITTPVLSDAAKAFIGAPFSATIKVNATQSAVTTGASFFENGTSAYAADASLAASATLTVIDASPIWGEDVTITAKPVSGYEFVGFYLGASAPADNVVITAPYDAETMYDDKDTDGDTSDDVYKYTFTNTSSTATAYNYIALYRQQVKVSAFKTYIKDGSTIKYITTPPKTITVKRHNAVVATYNFDNSVSVATPNGTYGTAVTGSTNNEITVGSGDTVEMHYSALSSTYSIVSAGFDNYNDSSLGNYHQYYDPPTFEQYIDPYVMTTENSGVVIDQENHKVSFVAGKGNTAAQENGDSTTVGYDRLRINLNVANKKSITFDEPDIVAPQSDYPLGGYFVIGESVSFKVKGASDGGCFYSLTSPTFTDEDDVDVTSSFSTSYDGVNDEWTISIGAMPAKNITVSFESSIKYGVNFRTYIVSDVDNNKTGGPIDSTIATITATNAGSSVIQNVATSEEAEAPTKPVANNYDYKVNAESSIKYTIDITASGYTPIGWYTGTDDGFDYKDWIATGDTVYFEPDENTTVWCVITRDFFINGSFNSWASIGDVGNNIKMNFDKDTGKYYYDVTLPDGATGTSNALQFAIFDTQATWTRNTWHNNDKMTFGVTSDDPEYHQAASYLCRGVVWGRKKMADGDATSGNGFIYQTSTQSDLGYSKNVRIYFYPSQNATDRANGKFDFFVDVKKTLKSIYVSDGYQGIENATTSHATTVSAMTSGAEEATLQYIAHGDGNADWNANSYVNSESVTVYREGAVKEYLIAADAATITVSRETADSSYKVSHFDIYNVTKDTVTSKAASQVESTNEYTCVIDLTDDDYKDSSMYIVPIFESTAANLMEVELDATDLVTDEWGDLVSCFVWYEGAGGEACGSYPGQLMVKEGNTWKAKFPAEKSSNKIAGVLFANYLDGSATWLGRNGVISASGQGEGAKNGLNISDIIPQYNFIHRGSVNTYDACNYKAQTYDYHEPVTLYERRDTGATSVTLSFSMKKGDSSDIMSWTHSELTAPGANILNNIQHAGKSGVNTEYLKQSQFSYLKDKSGSEYVDLNGKFIDGTPAPSFYIVSKGMATYLGGNLTNVFSTGNTYESLTPTAYTPIAGSDLKYAAQWYIYDASGNYITNLLSSSYCDFYNTKEDKLNKDKTRMIAGVLDALGYQTDGASVMIAYDNPRLCYNDGEGSVANAGSTFDCYRFEGQWFATSDIEMCKVNTLVALKSGDTYKIAKSNVQSYGRAIIEYNKTTASAAESGRDVTLYSDRAKTDKKKSYVSFAKSDLSLATDDYNLIVLTADSTNFIGWYKLESDNTLSDTIFSRSASHTLTNSQVENGQTYVALYQVVAQYKFTYIGNHGETVSKTVSHEMKTYEIDGYFGNNNTPGVPTYIWNSEHADYGTTQGADYLSNPYQTALNLVLTNVTTYQYDLNWSLDGENPATRNIIPSLQTVETIAYATPETYTVHYYDVNADHTVTAEHHSISVQANTTLTFNSAYAEIENVVVAPNIPERLGFTYWSADLAGKQPLTSVYTLGLTITHSMALYAQHSPMPDDVKAWIPTVESLSQTRTIADGSDKIYLDFNTYFASKNFRRIHEIEENKPHYGVFIAYTDNEETDATGFLTGTGKVKSYIKYLTNSTNPSSGYVTSGGVTTYMAVYDYNDNDHISDFNRANFSLSGNTTDINGKKLTFYSYVIEGDTVYLSKTKVDGVENCNKITVTPSNDATVFINSTISD